MGREGALFRQQSGKVDRRGACGRGVLLCTGLFLAAPLAIDCADAADAIAAQEPVVYVEERIDKAWEVSIRPFYGWVPGFDGKMGVFGQSPTEVAITPGDILENLSTFFDVLEGVYIGGGQVRRDEIGFFWDVVHIEVGAANPIEGNFTSGALDIGFSTTKAALAATYRLHESDTTHLDVLAGARITDIDLSVGVDLEFFGRFSTQILAADGDTWVDPLIGVRGRHNFTDRVFFDGWAFIGGFGVQSDILWDVYGVVGYEIRDWISAYAGYRGSYTDYQNDGFVWDVTMYGPILGFELKF